ncbi:hypothetical protein F5X99DRAFT_415913 [Biscogniauxia marginata]|nr:hypothetical protein F5X99DRAFT_415913 [Biscogniauxia marginata]
MTDTPPLSDIIQAHPIGKGLDAFRASFQSICEDRSISHTINALDQVGEEEIQDLAIGLLSALQILRISRLLPSRNRNKNLFGDLSRLNSAINSDDFDYSRIKPLLQATLADNPNDALIWDQVYKAVTEPTPPPQPIASSRQQTPWLHNTGSFANSSEYRQDMDKVLKLELGPLYVGLPQFRETYFGRVAGLEAASEAVLQRCTEGDNPIFDEGWRGWPEDANQDGVLAWFADVIERLATFAEAIRPSPARRRRPLAQPNKPIRGSTAERKLDVGFSQILIPGELKSNPSANTASKAWLDLGRYAREVLAAQDTRRFVLDFTLYGSIMRVWEFDRLGGIVSERFDIHEDGLQFVATILGFFWMTEKNLEFDPTILSDNDRQYIKITRNSQVEQLKAHREDNPQITLVIKDSWQYVEREEEGELLRDVTDKKVVNVARYYHHETVYVRGQVDDIQHNVRGGMNVTEAGNYRPRRSIPLPTTIIVTDLRKGQGSSAAGTKRPSSQTSAPLPVNKRSCSTSPTKADSNLPANRIHRRGHESLRNAGLLHRDISANNLMINEDPDNPSWLRKSASGAQGRTGTRAFMAIGTLLGEQHSFMHDLESFFWVLFWICIHYDGPGKSRLVPRFNKWNFVEPEELAEMKLAVFPNGGRWKKEDEKLYARMKEILRAAQTDLEVTIAGK